MHDKHMDLSIVTHTGTSLHARWDAAFIRHRGWDECESTDLLYGGSFVAGDEATHDDVLKQHHLKRRQQRMTIKHYRHTTYTAHVFTHSDLQHFHVTTENTSTIFQLFTTSI